MRFVSFFPATVMTLVVAACQPAVVSSQACSISKDCGPCEVCLEGSCAPCQGGRLCVDGRCEILCNADRECPLGQCQAGICVLSPPEIGAVQGSGTQSCPQATAGTCFTDRLLVTGRNLTPATFELRGTKTHILERIGESASPATLMLPVNLEDGDYLLVAQNSIGEDREPVQILRGEPGLCDPSDCRAGAFPGVGQLSTLRLRGVNPLDTDNAPELVINGVEQISTPAPGFWLAVMSRASHTTVDYSSINGHYLATGSGGLADLFTNIANLDADALVMLVSVGDVSAALSRDLGGVTLLEALKDLGAPDFIADLSASEAFAMVSYRDLGAGNGVLLVSDTGGAETTMVLLDEQLLGPRTGSRLGRSIESEEIVDGTVVAADVDIPYATGVSQGGAALDLDCTDCVSATEVNIPYAGSASQGGAANDLSCTGCVSAAEVDISYAGSASQGGAANDLSCTGCVSASEVAMPYAGSASQGGAASDLSCSGCVSASEVSIPYAGSASQGGAASDLSCTGCVSASEVSIPYAGSASQGGAASDLSCTGCVSASEVAIPYAGSASQGGAASDLSCTGCVSASEVAIPYAGSASQGGAASDLACSNCVSSGEVSFPYVKRVHGSAAIEVSAGTAPTIAHADTSDQDSVNNPSEAVIGSVSLDGFGHVTGLAPKHLNYYFHGRQVVTSDCLNCTSVIATCPGPKKVVGGGCDQSGSMIASIMQRNRPCGSLYDCWNCRWTVGGPDTRFTAYAICADVD